jgi:hypothetical protein
MILPNLLSLFIDMNPEFSFQPSSYYNQQRQTSLRSVPYFMNAKRFESSFRNDQHRLGKIERDIELEVVESFFNG